MNRRAGRQGGQFGLLRRAWAIAEILPDRHVTLAGNDDAAGAGQPVSQRLGRADADGRDAKRQRQPARGGDGNADAGEVAGAGTDADQRQIAPTGACTCQHLLDQGHQAFGLSLGHVLGDRCDQPVARQQSGRAMRGRCVEAKHQPVTQWDGPRSPRGYSGAAGSRSPFSGSWSRTGSPHRHPAYADRPRHDQSRGR